MQLLANSAQGGRGFLGSTGLAELLVSGLHVSVCVGCRLMPSPGQEHPVDRAVQTDAKAREDVPRRDREFVLESGWYEVVRLVARTKQPFGSHVPTENS